MTDPETSIKTIGEFELEIREALKLLRMYKDNLEKVLDDKDHVYYYLTVSFGVETYEGYLRWCKEAKGILKNRQ